MIERKPAAKTFRLAGGAIGKFRIGMQTRHWRVRPWAMTWFPGGDDPARAAGIVAGDVRGLEGFVGVGLSFEAFGAFKHHAVLDAQVAQRCFRAIDEREFH